MDSRAIIPHPNFDPGFSDFLSRETVTIKATAIVSCSTPESRKHLSAYFEGPLPEDPREKAQKYLVCLLVLGSDYSLPRTSLEFFPFFQTNILDDLGIESVYQPPLPPRGRPGMSKYSTERFNPCTNKKEHFYVIVNRDPQGLLHAEEPVWAWSNTGTEAVSTGGHCVHSPKLRQTWKHGKLKTIHGTEVDIRCDGEAWELIRKLNLFDREKIRDLNKEERREICRILGIW